MLIPLIRQALEDEWSEMRRVSNLANGFTRARRVEPGASITSTDWNLFAAAVNERILSGLGDACWRICEYLLGLYRSMLAPSDDPVPLWHSEAEYFEVMQALEPHVAQWPTAGVGDTGLPEPEGPNMQNPMMAWVYGNVQAGLDNESLRLRTVPYSLNANTPEERWMNGIGARGSVDPATGYESAPARELALQFAKLAYRKDSVYGLTYGGFLPGPSKLSHNCKYPCAGLGYGDGQCLTPTRDNLEIKFTAVRDTDPVSGVPDVPPVNNKPSGPVDTDYYTDDILTIPDYHIVTLKGTCLLCEDAYETDGVTGLQTPMCDDIGDLYAGACPNDGTNPDYCHHLLVHYELPVGWWCVFNDGATMFFPRNDWIEGPYEQVSHLAHDYGDQIRRVVNGFNREFRGADSQRAVPGYNLGNAFDDQAYYTQQNYLAPNYGQQAGDTMTALYPTWRLGAGVWTAGQKLQCDAGSTNYSWHDGFLATHLFVILRTADPSKSIEMTMHWSGGERIITATDDGEIIKLAADERLTDVYFDLNDADTLDAGESILVMVTELQECKPEWYDRYVVTRKGGARLVGDNVHMDGVGTEEEDSLAIWEAYNDEGIIFNPADEPEISEPTSVNENAVYDSARRMYQTVRIMNRFQFVDYEVEGGDSILYFRPNPRTDEYSMKNPEDLGDPSIDLFTGMTVQRVPPDAEDENAIQGKNSRWVMGVWLKPYAPPPPSEEDPKNILDRTLYGDHFPDINRCYVDDRVSAADTDDFNRHTNRGADLSTNLFGQAPSGWNYAKTFDDKYVNHTYLKAGLTDVDRINFAKSCRIYEPPIEIKSIETIWRGNEEIRKVRLMGRLRNTSGETGGAPDTISTSGWLTTNTGTPGGATSPNGWSFNSIRDEPFACEERNLRLYLFERWQDKHDVSGVKPGDGSQSWEGYTRYGDSARQPAIIPHFHFVKLLPQVKFDQDDYQDSEDHLFLSDEPLQAEWMLRCMVEGAVAGEGTLDCTDPVSARAYDWTWRNLCNELFGIPSVGSFAMTETADLTATDIRADGPEGFGPLPNTYASAEVFNRLVDIVNALTRYRVMLPWAGQYCEATNSVNKSVIADGLVDYGCGVPSGCSVDPWGGKIAYPWQGNPCPKGAYSDWTDLTGAWLSMAHTECTFQNCEYVLVWNDVEWVWSPTDNYALVTTRVTNLFRFDLIDPHIYQNAIPESWRGLVNEASQSLGTLFRDEWIQSTFNTDGVGELITTCSGFTCDFYNNTTGSDKCMFVRGGYWELDCGELAPGGWKIADFANPACRYGPGIRHDMTLIADKTLVVEFQTVERDEWVVVPKTEDEVMLP